MHSFLDGKNTTQGISWVDNEKMEIERNLEI